MTVLFIVELNSDVSSVSSLFDESEGRKVVKSGVVIILLNGRRCRNAVQVLHEEGRHPWIDGPLLSESRDSWRWSPDIVSWSNQALQGR